MAKLIERLSPNKTWEGFYGGGIACILTGIFISMTTATYSTSFWIIISIICWLGGVIGDLCQSSVKRNFEFKDSGSILPGHGGFFDRFDSLVFVLPFVYLTYQLFYQLI